MNILSVLQSPVVSEKSNGQRDKFNKYTFNVALAANKLEIAKAIELAYDVKVKSVSTTITRGKVRRRGNFISQPAKYKKATVALMPDQKIPIFDDN